MNYYVLEPNTEDTDVFLSVSRDIEDAWELAEGVPRADNWPTDAFFDYNEVSPEGLSLTDWLDNPSGLIIVNEKLKGILETAGVEEVEYLPIKLRDHKKRPVKAQFWLANTLSCLVGVDRERSEYRPIGKDKPGGEILSFSKLVLLDEVVENGPMLFRLKEESNMVLFREDLAEQIEAAEVSGFKLLPATNYKSWTKRRHESQ